MTNPVLDEFGEFLMARIRDTSIREFANTVDSKMKGDGASHYAAIMDRAGEAGRDAIRKLLPDIVDVVLHHLLWSLEQSRRIHVVVADQEQCPESLKLKSDGFPHELYTEEGWIAKFSSAPRGYF